MKIINAKHFLDKFGISYWDTGITFREFNKIYNSFLDDLFIKIEIPDKNFNGQYTLILDSYIYNNTYVCIDTSNLPSSLEIKNNCADNNFDTFVTICEVHE